MSFDDEVRAALAARSDVIRDDPELAATVVARAQKSRRRAWLLRALIAVLSILVAVVLVTTNVFGRSRVTGPDPRGTGQPVRTATPAVSTSPTASAKVTTPYLTVDGPAPTVNGTGAAVSLVPRVERRTSGTWFVTSGVSMVLPTSVNGARKIEVAGSGWILLTVSDTFTGGDSDPGAQILAISSTGSVRSLVTGDVRSLAVSPDGTQVASVETTDRPWTVRLLVRSISNASVVRTVSIPFGQSGQWPYKVLLWTSIGILASNQSRGITQPRASIVVQQDTVTDLASVTGFFQLPGQTNNTFATFAQAGLTCVGSLPAPVSDTPVMSCGPFGNVTPLGKGLLLVTLVDSDGKQAVLIDVAKSTLTRLTLPDPVAKTYLNEAFAETATTVLVPDFETKVWLRWDVVQNSVEQAPLPAGASSVITW